jgi:hypothetical protein
MIHHLERKEDFMMTMMMTPRMTRKKQEFYIGKEFYKGKEYL